MSQKAKKLYQELQREIISARKDDGYEKYKRYWVGRYAGRYIRLSGDTAVEAIKYFYSRYNAQLSFLVDARDLTVNTVVIGRENDIPDVRGRYNYSFYKDKKLVFNCDTLTKPLVKINPVMPTRLTKDHQHGWVDPEGNFYECGFETHRYNAEELFLSKTLTKTESEKYKDAEVVLENRGWMKVSSKRFHYLYRKRLTGGQKDMVRRLMNVYGDKSYEFQYTQLTREEIIEELKEI